MFQNGFVIVFPANCDIENTIFRFGAFGADRYLYYIYNITPHVVILYMKAVEISRLLRNNLLWRPRNLVSVGVSRFWAALTGPRASTKSIGIIIAKIACSGDTTGSSWRRRMSTLKLVTFNLQRHISLGITWHNIACPPRKGAAPTALLQPLSYTI